MVVQGGKVPGDVIYSQHAWIDEHPIKSGVSVTKGNIYTKDADGYIIVPTASSSVANLSSGRYQAMASNRAPTSGDSNGARVVQCISDGIILIDAPANTTEGDLVALATASSTVVDPDKVKIITSYNAGFMGRVFKVYEQTNAGVRTRKTANNDVVAVWLGRL